MKIVSPCSLDMKSPEFIAYRNALMELVPVNTAAKAAKYREIWTKFHGKVLEVPPNN
jgi:hypothetical protein